MLDNNYSKGKTTKMVEENASDFFDWENYDDNVDALVAFLQGEDEQYSNPYIIMKDAINRKFGEQTVNDEASVIKFISSEMKSKDIPFQRKSLENWVNGKSNPQGNESSKKLAFQIAFALGLSVEECTNLISKMLFIRAFNFKKPDEIVLYYFIKNNLNYNDAISFCESLNLSEATDNAAKETRIVFDDINNIDTLNDLKSYLETNAGVFKKQLVTAHSYFEQLLENAIEISKKQKGKEDVNKQAGSVDFLLENIFDFNVKKVKKEKSISKISRFAPYVTLNFPSSINFSKALSGQDVNEDILRKAIILLHFYTFFSDEVQKEYGNLIGLEEYKDSINNILWDCGFSPLYSRNPYDVIFIICVINSSDDPFDPIEVFHEIYSIMYADLTEEPFAE